MVGAHRLLEAQLFADARRPALARRDPRHRRSRSPPRRAGVPVVSRGPEDTVGVDVAGGDHGRVLGPRPGLRAIGDGGGGVAESRAPRRLREGVALEGTRRDRALDQRCHPGARHGIGAHVVRFRADRRAAATAAVEVVAAIHHPGAVGQLGAGQRGDLHSAGGPAVVAGRGGGGGQRQLAEGGANTAPQHLGGGGGGTDATLVEVWDFKLTYFFNTITDFSTLV